MTSTAVVLPTVIRLDRAIVQINPHQVTPGAFYVEVLTRGPVARLIPEHTRPFRNWDEVENHIAFMEGIYGAIPDTIAELTPAPVEQVEPRTPTLAALANLKVAGWTVRKIAAEIGVTPQAVYRWLKGYTPSERNYNRLEALSNSLAEVGDGCGCQGYGVVHTGERYDGRTTYGRIDQLGRCGCNPA